MYHAPKVEQFVRRTQRLWAGAAGAASTAVVQSPDDQNGPN